MQEIIYLLIFTSLASKHDKDDFQCNKLYFCCPDILPNSQEDTGQKRIEDLNLKFHDLFSDPNLLIFRLSTCQQREEVEGGETK